MSIRTFGMILALLAPLASANASLFDKVKDLLGEDQENQSSLEDLTTGEVTTGLKQALAEGVRVAINSLGTEGGFWNNDDLRIPVPERLEPLAKAAERLGQDRVVEDFRHSLNRAAEEAVPSTADLFAEAIESMTLEDAKNIVRGADDAATRFFEEAAGDALRERMLPLIQEATDRVGVTQAYKSLEDRASGLLGLLGAGDEVDLDAYVTDYALAGLFDQIADQERQIRENPAARTTDLLKAIFGG